MFRHADVVGWCLVRILWQFSMLHDLQFINAGRGCKRRPYGSFWGLGSVREVERVG